MTAWLTLLVTPAALAGPGSPLSQTESTDRDGDGSTDFIRITEYTYDARGQITRRLVTIDSNADSNADERHLYSYSYDPKGKLASWLHGSDRTADGTYESWHGKNWWDGEGSRHFREWHGPHKNGKNPDSAEGWDRYRYMDKQDGTRNLSRITWFDRNGDGQPELRKARQSHHHPVSGRLVETNKGTDTDGSAPWEHFERRHYTYSEDGNAFDFVTDVIRDGMEYPGAWGGGEKSYDQRGNVLEESMWRGIDDGATSHVRNWYEYEYDEVGRIVYQTKSEDLLGPPDPERWNSWTRSYHANGQLKEEINTGWYNKVIDMTNEINWEIRELRDSRGNLLSKTSVRSNIVLNTRESESILRTHDDFGRLVKVRKTSSNRLDGRPEKRTIKTLSRDSNGLIHEIVEEMDTNADGHTDHLYRCVINY